MMPYDTTFAPPAPVVPVYLSGIVNTRPRIRISALIDTAADVTAVPSFLVNRLKLYPVGYAQLEGIEAVKTPVFTYKVRLILADQIISPLEVVLVEYDFVVLGRDVLADYYLLLNGPEATFDLKISPIVATT
jgi:hypothetical protein